MTPDRSPFISLAACSAGDGTNMGRLGLSGFPEPIKGTTAQTRWYIISGETRFWADSEVKPSSTNARARNMFSNLLSWCLASWRVGMHASMVSFTYVQKTPHPTPENERGKAELMSCIAERDSGKGHA